MSFLTGKSESKNLAYPFLKDSFGGAATAGVNAGQAGLGQVQSILSGADNGAGYDTYKNSTGYENIFNEAMRGVSSNAAARGLLASGSTARALADRGGQLGQQNFPNYLQQLLGVSQAQSSLGTNLAGLIGQAGQTSKQREGLLSAIGGAAQGIGAAVAASDPRLKKNVELLEVEPDGLGIYAFRYNDDSPDLPLLVGVMADEVARIRPHALGPLTEGYMSVDYGKLG